MRRDLKNCDIQQAARDLRMRLPEKTPPHRQRLFQVVIGGGVVTLLGVPVAETVHGARDVGTITRKKLAVDVERLL